MCSTLRLLIASGHTTVYQWKTGHVPTSIGASDDYLPKMLDEERKRIERFKAEAETTMDELDVSSPGLLEYLNFNCLNIFPKLDGKCREFTCFLS